jgi:hypothetical protein
VLLGLPLGLPIGPSSKYGKISDPVCVRAFDYLGP